MVLYIYVIGSAKTLHVRVFYTASQKKLMIQPIFDFYIKLRNFYTDHEIQFYIVTHNLVKVKALNLCQFCTRTWRVCAEPITYIRIYDCSIRVFDQILMLVMMKNSINPSLFSKLFGYNCSISLLLS